MSPKRQSIVTVEDAARASVQRVVDLLGVRWMRAEPSWDKRVELRRRMVRAVRTVLARYLNE